MTKLPIAKDFSKFSSGELRNKLAHALEATAAGLYEAAEIWAELHRRGESLPHMSGILQWLPRIARGELAAEAVIGFAGQHSLIAGLVGMPLDQQRKYAAGDAISVATFDEDGKAATELKPMTALSAKEVKLAIDRGQVRPVKAQINSLKRSRTETETKGHYSSVTIRADVGAGLLVIGNARISLSDSKVLAAIRALGFRLERIEGRPANKDAQAERPGL